MDFQILAAQLRAQQPAMLMALEELVNNESPSNEKPMLDTFAQLVDRRYREAGAKVNILENPDSGNHIQAVFPGGSGDPAVRPAMILGHFDTVWPLGTVAQRPFRIQDGMAFGAGVFDMKTSIVMAEFACRAVLDLAWKLPRPVVIVLTSDEEVGSQTSRSLIEEEAGKAEYVLVMEPPLPNATLKTARKGVGRFVVEIEGRSAHAGIDPEKGLSAIQELAHQILYLSGLSRPSEGTTVNVGIVRGGTRTNVIPDRAEAEIDVRVWTRAESERIREGILNAKPAIPGVAVNPRGGFPRPPMERTPVIASLFQRAKQIGTGLGLELQEGSTGGASDGNFTAALGVPTLDGLGCPGDGAHAVHEHIEVDALPIRTALLAALLMKL